MDGLNSLIKKTAREIGFTACGISRAEPLVEEKEYLNDWISQGYYAGMNYLSRLPEKRLDPRSLLEEAKTLITLAYYYLPDPALIPEPPYRIARFALGKDYHEILKEKMQDMVNTLQTITGPFTYSLFTDSAPLLEKAWAVKSGTGWIGKNTLFQVPGKGSWFLLAEILTDLEIETDPPYSGQHCGNCNRCLQACPTGALVAPYVLDARKCLSYLNNEHKEDFSDPVDLHGRLFGCDICQEVCPFNHFAPPLENSWLEPEDTLAKMKEKDWNDLDEASFKSLFRNSGILRGGFARLLRNLHTINQK
jgi:epoxyqueuosine reductase